MKAITKIELHTDGCRVIFHRAGGKAWTHPEDDPHLTDFDGKERRGVPVRHPCPVCSRTSGARPVALRPGSRRALNEETA